MCYDVINLGERELRFSQRQLLELIEPLQQTSVVSANVGFTSPDEGEDCSELLNVKVKPCRRLCLGGHWLYVTGVTSPGTTKHGLAQGHGITVEDPHDSLGRVLGMAGRDDTVIVLVSGLTQEELDGVIALDRIDVIIGVEKPSATTRGRDKSSESLPIQLSKGLDRGRAVGYAELFLDGCSSVEIVTSRFDKLLRGMPRPRRGAHPAHA